MPPRKEPCRNFQRGFCQYGERCKFLHANQQQPKPNSNPFGFGTQNATSANPQPQRPNPFGFGVQNNAQIGSNPNQFKPGENKWSRFSQTNAGTSTAPQKQDKQSPAPNHVCTDSESCKRQIREDFEQEKPLWKLTCYGHLKYGPCDIVGDLSYEELRAAVYDEAKRGSSIQSIVEKERSLLSAKLIEFENLLRNPYRPPQNQTTQNTQNTLPGANTNLFPQLLQNTQNTLPGTNANLFPQMVQNTQNTLPGTNANLFPQMVQNNSPPMVSSFSQLGTGFQMRPAAPNNAFGQVNQFQPPPTQMSNSFSFGNPGQLSSQPSFPATANTFGNTFSTSAISPNLNSASQQPSMQFGGQNPSVNVVPAPVSTVQIPQSILNSNSNGDNSIWLKDGWRPGEIPEEAPPDGVIY